ncbi:hypothetical protein H4J59_00805 [Colwellia sp. MB02u-10]|nr:hypothetical protein [Colwellia sp. MB02u-10]MBA6339553.1 hypothetical protein [Colwellia sp. MB02u-10]
MAIVLYDIFYVDVEVFILSFLIGFVGESNSSEFEESHRLNTLLMIRAVS